MNALFATVLSASLYGGAVGLVLLAAKWLLNGKISAKWQLGLWAILILRLVLPFAPSSRLSLFNMLPQHTPVQTVPFAPPADWTGDAAIVLPAQVSTAVPEAVSETLPDVMPEREAALLPQNPSPAPTAIALAVLPHVWLGGAVITLCWFFLSSLLLRRKLRASAHVPNARIAQIFEACADDLGLRQVPALVMQDTVKTPALLGFLRPMILIDDALNTIGDEQVRYILLHELSHYKRHDTLLNAALALVQSVHWFNPAVWFCFSKIREDMEQANDQDTLHYISPSECTQYANALLMVLGRASRLSPSVLGAVGGKRTLMRRIQMIKRNEWLHRRKWMTTLLCVVIAVVLSTALLTDAMGSIAPVKSDAAALWTHYLWVEGRPVCLLNEQGRDTNLIQYQGSVYLPVPSAGEWLGKEVRWDAATQTVTLSGSVPPVFHGGGDQAGATEAELEEYARLKNDGITVTVCPDVAVLIDGVRQTFRNANGDVVSPISFDGVIYLPVRSIGELLGMEVTWASWPDGERGVQIIFLRTPLTDTQAAEVSAYTTAGFALCDAMEALSEAMLNESNAFYRAGKELDAAWYAGWVTEYQALLPRFSALVRPEIPLADSCHSSLLAVMCDTDAFITELCAALQAGTMPESEYPLFSTMYFAASGLRYEFQRLDFVLTHKGLYGS